MKGLPEERAVKLAQYIIEQDATVRQAAKKFVISKSTVHKDVSERLIKIQPQRRYPAFAADESAAVGTGEKGSGAQ